MLYIQIMAWKNRDLIPQNRQDNLRSNLPGCQKLKLKDFPRSDYVETRQNLWFMTLKELICFGTCKVVGLKIYQNWHFSEVDLRLLEHLKWTSLWQYKKLPGVSRIAFRFFAMIYFFSISLGSLLSKNIYQRLLALLSLIV